MTTINRPTVDFQAIRTVTTLRQFAEKVGSAPYLWFRGLRYSPLFVGAAERPAFRVSASLEDRGIIVQAWPDGTGFRSQRDSYLAMLAEAAGTAPDDPTAAEARRILENGGRGRRTEPLAAAQVTPDTTAPVPGETRGGQVVKPGVSIESGGVPSRTAFPRRAPGSSSSGARRSEFGGASKAARLSPGRVFKESASVVGSGRGCSVDLPGQRHLTVLRR